MSNDTKFVVRFTFWLVLVVGFFASPFAYQDYVMHVCKEVYPESTRDAGNCYWQQMYGENIYK